MLMYLDVPYEEKDDAKCLGAKWDNSKRKWYFNGSINEFHKFYKWMDLKSAFPHTNRFYFDVQMSDIDIVKEHGAKWDSKMKSWYYEISSNESHNSTETFSQELQFKQTINSLKEELSTAYHHITLLKQQLEELELINENLRATSSPSGANKQFPLFSGCNSKDELRQRYKLLCKLLHPDNNSEILTKNFQDIQSQYNKLLNTF